MLWLSLWLFLVAFSQATGAVPSESLADCVPLTPSTYFCNGVVVKSSALPAVRSTSAGGSSNTSSGNGIRYTPYDTVSVAPDGSPCIGTGYVPEGQPIPRPVRGISDTEQTPGSISSIYDTAPPCPAPSPFAGAAQLETPAMVARRYWEQRTLPAPRPTIAPGRAITGKLAYLETRGQLRDVNEADTVLGRLSVIASGEYTIDWGDGTTTGPYAFEGQPWPHGEITHDYLNVGHYDIVITERWTATWSLAGQTGVLRELRTVGSIENFPVDQIQAVVGR